jgi:ABC-type branched-subunit amino acid transport system substrate-binding protein
MGIMKNKYVLLVLIATLGLVSGLIAQSFDDGLKLYESGDYEKALETFSSLNNQRGLVFKGKTLFMLNRLDEARLVLLSALDGENHNLTADALYTLSLIYVIGNNPAKALDYLVEISYLDGANAIVKTDAKRQFNVMNSFLNFQERVKVIKQAEFSESIYEVIHEGVRIETQKDAATLLDFALRLREANIIDEVAFKNIEQQYLQNRKKVRNYPTNTPEGYSYTIGVLLPTSDKTSPLFSVSRDIFQGLQISVDEFNSKSKTTRIYLKHAQVPDTTNSVANLVIEESVDVIIGPLTSENAKDIVTQAEQMHIPVIAPLANNDSLNIDNPYFYQLNPTFRTRGKQVADFAIEQLSVDTVAIMVDKNSMGYISALAFKEEMERNNVHVAYFFAEPFEQTAYDIAAYTQYFTSDPILIDSLDIPEIDAVYMPFTGAQSETLIDLTLTDLEAGKSNIPVLGSQDWGYVELTPERLNRFTIYFPDASQIDETNEKVIQFRQNYMDISKQQEASIFSFLGYDLGSFLIQLFNDVKNPSYIKQALVNKPVFQGLANQIKFDESHVNQQLSIYKMDKNGILQIK